MSYLPLRQRMGPGTFGCSSACWRRSQIANNHTQDASDTSQSRARVFQPLQFSSQNLRKDCRTRRSKRTFSLFPMYSTMYSFASFAAFTLVSVPCTGRANESMITIDVPTTFPCMRPIISYGTPERAWMTCMDDSQFSIDQLIKPQIPFWSMQ